MPDETIKALITEAVKNVLETMFFSEPLGAAEPECGNGALEARVSFRGDPGGTLLLSVSAPAARMLAGDFLGEDAESLADSSPGQVVCELANMICGRLLSQLESSAIFELETPELVSPASGDEHVNAPASVQQSFQLENGVLSVTLHFGVPA